MKTATIPNVPPVSRAWDPVTVSVPDLEGCYANCSELLGSKIPHFYVVVVALE